MKISQRVERVEYSAIRKLSPIAKRAEEAGKKIYHLNIGAPDIDVPDIYFDTFKNIERGALPYAPSEGIKELREAISKYYKDRNINYAPDEIIITSGASEALLFAVEAVADYNDEIITTDPFYTNYNTVFQQLNVNIETFKTKPETGFAIPDKETIEKAVTDKSVAVLISNPTNPTGAMYSREELERICEVAIENDLFIIADEVYREFIYDGNEFVSFGELPGIEDRLILVDSISKRFAACGARIGSIASKNKEFMAAMDKLTTSRLAVATLEQVAAAKLYEETDEYFKKVNEEYQKRRDTIYEELNKIPGVSVEKPRGAFYIMPTLPVEDSEDFAKWLLESFDVDGETIMVAPANGFFKNPEDGKSMVRLAFILNNDKIKKSMRILKEGLKEYNLRNE
ncbi:pyridoxal phosphate-dependent aminotransferase [Peptoniphilus sp.]|jgi:aspartate aminotransferase|uniref:pyridoxal phosphate-dependent aminotransferase n=1 Tax=Peptoniphilus sp. TaxID=1971214 RepID=UPI003D8CBD5A